MGEWQKLAIARTFAKDADTVFLDEPNAALDAVSDYEISCLYQKLLEGKMGIIIAHKFSNLVNYANRVFVLDKGCLVESGSHRELMDKRAIYFEMFCLQNSRYEQLG